jgi:hypothetical protein
MTMAGSFHIDLGCQKDGYFNALVQFEQALKVIAQLSASNRNALVARLDELRVISHNFRLCCRQ